MTIKITLKDQNPTEHIIVTQLEKAELREELQKRVTKDDFSSAIIQHDDIHLPSGKVSDGIVEFFNGSDDYEKFISTLGAAGIV